MKKTKTLKTILMAATLLVTGATVALARGGYGCDNHYDGNWHGRHMMNSQRETGCESFHNNLSKEEAAKVDAERDRFFNETRTLRRDIDDKAYELHKSINSDDPDAAKISALQKELSKLKADFDQKRVQHRLAMRKILPQKDLGRGWGPNYGRGRDRDCWQR